LHSILNYMDESFNEKYRKRTKQNAVDLFKFFNEQKLNHLTLNVFHQIIRSSTSTAANFRASCRARSDAEYYAKICRVVEECDETLFWLEFIHEANILPEEKLAPFIRESTELLQVFSTT
jgi:four helix bundle protein